MALTFPKVYTNLIKGLMKGEKSVFDRINSAFTIENKQVGAITVNVMTEVAAVDIVDGTILTDGSTNAIVNMTYVDKAAPISLKPSQRNSFMRDPENQATAAALGADSIMQAAMNHVVADFINGTPGKAVTLPAGNTDFANDGSDTDIRSNVLRIAYCLAYVLTFCKGRPLSEFYILTTETGLGNLLTLTDSEIWGKSFRQDEGDGRLYFKGIPIYSVTGPANWGGVTKHALILAHRSACGCKFDDVYIHGADVYPNGWMPAPDGMEKLIPIGTYAHGLVLGDLFAEVINPTS